jgi:7-cyano-7-deazaguanine synthase in queuosine biosynthesis
MEEAMLTIRFMEKDDQDAHMLKKKLTYPQITDQVESHYINLLNKEEWMPAKNAAPSKFGAVKATTETMTKAEIMALVQQSGYPKQQNESCFNCGEMGHWKQECPKLKGNKGKSDGN